MTGGLSRSARQLVVELQHGLRAQSLIHRRFLPSLLLYNTADRDGFAGSSPQYREMFSNESRQELHVVIDDTDPRGTRARNSAMPRYRLARIRLKLVS